MGTAKDFAQGLKRFNDVARKKATRRLRRVSQKALEAIVDGTPVLTGCCKGNWNVSTDGALKRQFDAKKLDPNGAATVAAGRAKIESAVLGDIFDLTQNSLAKESEIWAEAKKNSSPATNTQSLNDATASVTA